jgi:hypothetical protein
MGHETTHAVQHFSQVSESPPGRAAAVPPRRALIRIKKRPKYFLGQKRLFSAWLITAYSQVSPMRRTLPWLKM